MPFITSSLNDQKLQLGFEEFVRPMVFKGAWRKIRVGVLGYVYVDPVAWGTTQFSGVLISRHFDLYLGVCQGIGGSFYSNNTIEAWMMSPFETAGGQPLQRDGANFGTFAASMNPGKLVSKFGQVLTTTTNNSTGTWGTIYPQLGQYFVDIQLPGGPGQNISFTYCSSGYGTGQVPITRSTFLQNMEIEFLSSLTLAAQIGNPFTQVYNGSFNLDCVDIAWTRNIPTFEITEVCVTRFM